MLLVTVRHFTGLSGPAELQFAVLALLGIAGLGLGLAISAAAGTSERAMTVLPVSLIGLAIFSGGLARLSGLPLRAAQIASPAYGSLDGLKAPLASALKNATYPGAPGSFQPPILGPGGPVVLDGLVLVLQAAVLLAAAFAALRWTLGRNVR